MSHPSSRPLPLVDSPDTFILAALEGNELTATRLLFQEYAQALGIDLGFQDFDEELATLPGDYAEPRGTLLLALVNAAPHEAPPSNALTLRRGDGALAQVAGCCALRPLDTTDYPNAAEMKRLYVRPAFRGLGLGRQLTESILDAARAAGYGCVLLDTLDAMEAARGLYEELGFTEVPPYYHNPIAGAHYLKVDLL